MDIFDSDSDNGLSVLGVIGVALIFGLEGYFVWEFAYARGTDDALRLDAPGCVITSVSGKPVAIADLKLRGHVVIPKDATFTSQCINAR